MVKSIARSCRSHAFSCFAVAVLLGVNVGLRNVSAAAPPFIQQVCFLYVVRGSCTVCWVSVSFERASLSIGTGMNRCQFLLQVRGPGSRFWDYFYRMPTTLSKHNARPFTSHGIEMEWTRKSILTREYPHTKVVTGIGTLSTLQTGSICSIFPSSIYIVSIRIQFGLASIEYFTNL